MACHYLSMQQLHLCREEEMQRDNGVLCCWDLIIAINALPLRTGSLPTRLYCIACSFVCKWIGATSRTCMPYQYLRTTGYILQSSRLPPCEAPVLTAESMKYSCFVLNPVLNSKRCSPGRVALPPSVTASCRRLSKTLLSTQISKHSCMMTGVWTSSQTMPMWRVWCSAAPRWRKWASMKTRLWRSMETLIFSPRPSRELCMDSASCVFGFAHLAGPVRLTQHMSCLQTCHHMCRMALLLLVMILNGSLRCLLGLTQYKTACMCALWSCGVRWLSGRTQYRIACISCTLELFFMCCAYFTKGMVLIEPTRKVC